MCRTRTQKVVGLRKAHSMDIASNIIIPWEQNSLSQIMKVFQSENSIAVLTYKIYLYFMNSNLP